MGGVRGNLGAPGVRNSISLIGYLGQNWTFVKLSGANIISPDMLKGLNAHK
jgi:hypothetical protein